MATPIEAAVEIQKMREALHAKIDEVPSSSLASLKLTVQECELKHLRKKLDDGFTEDRAANRFLGEKVGNAVALHRARHPYRA